MNAECSVLRQELNQLREELRNSKDKEVILQAKDEIRSASSDALQVLIGLFGLLLTILVIVFGFRTEKAAARAASAEVADRRQEIDAIIADSKLAAAAAYRASQSAEEAAKAAGSHAASAAQAITDMNLQRERSKVPEPIVDEGRHFDNGSGSHKINNDDDEWRIIEEQYRCAVDEERWIDVIRLGSRIAYHDKGDNRSKSEALFQIAYAIGKTGDDRGEIQGYTEVIEKFLDAEDYETQFNVLRSISNRALTYGNMDVSDLEDQDFDLVIEKFSSSKNVSILDGVADAYFWKAANRASNGNIMSPIGYLREWARLKSNFDCKKIRDSVFFKGILESPKFSKFLKEMGC